MLEPGPAGGWLGRDLLQAASGPFAAALRYLHRDDNPAARTRAREALAPFLASGRARLVAQDQALEPFRGAVVSNELFDALPAQPWRWDGERWEFEALAASGPVWLPGASLRGHRVVRRPGRGRPGARRRRPLVRGPAGPGPGPGRRAGGRPVPGHRLRRDRRPRLLDKGADLRRFKGHTWTASGGRTWAESDLTADVDFTRLARLLEAEGLRPAPLQTLGRWIRAHAPLARWEAEWQGLPAGDRLRRMENLLQLTLPSQMGDRLAGRALREL